jgi:hypothetical protein
MFAEKLDARIKQAVAGTLHAQRVTVPPWRKQGPAPGGPDLASLALQTTDLNGPAAEVAPTGYYLDYDPAVLSTYGMYMTPAGQFTSLSQDIRWYPTANLARFTSDFAAPDSSPAPAVDLTASATELGDGTTAASRRSSSRPAG